LKKIIRRIRESEDFNAFQKRIRLLDSIKIPKPEYNFADIFSGRSARILRTRSSSRKNRKSRPGKQYRSVMLLSGLVFLLVGGASFIYFYTHIPVLPKEQVSSTEGSVLDYVTLEDNKYRLIDKIVRKKTKIFYYNEQDLTKDFQKIKKYIQQKKYNKALILLNKIDNSNANIAVKEKIAFLKDFIGKIDDTYQEAENIAFKTIASKPFLYQGVMIKWNGKVSNYEVKNKKTMFSLLINYQEKDVFTGIADIFYDKEKELENGQYVFVIGTIKSILENNSRLYVHAKSITKR
jgi:hypothetical protein